MFDNNIYINELIAKYKDEFDRTYFYGVPIIELNKEQLMAVITFIGQNRKCDNCNVKYNMHVMQKESNTLWQ